MSKTFLVELTERELEVIQNGLIDREASLHDSIENLQVVKTTGEKKLEACHSAWAKLDESRHDRPDLLITSKDLFLIKSLAKGEFQNLTNDLHISNKKVEEEDFVHISLANALIMWLNSKNLLKNIARFDFTDHSSEFEEMEE